VIDEKEYTHYDEIEETNTDMYGRRHWKVISREKVEVEDERQMPNEKDNMPKKFVAPIRTVPFIRRTQDLGIDNCVNQKITIAKDTPEELTSNYYCQICEVAC